MNRKLNFFLFGALVLLVIVFIGVIVVSFFVSKNQPPNSGPDVQSPTPFPFRGGGSSGGFHYSSDAAEQIQEHVTNRQPLSEADQQARQKLIDIRNQPGSADTDYIYVSADFSIEYLKTPDEFLVEISNPDVNTTRKAAVSWFEQQGVSSQGICNLPIVFYPNSRIMQQLRSIKGTFSPLPDGC